MLKLQMEKVPGLRGLLLILIAICWIVGNLLNAWLQLPQMVLLVLSGITLIVSCISWKERASRYTGLAILALLMGAWRYASVSPFDGAHTIKNFIGTSKLEVQGSVIDEPRLGTNSSLLNVSTSSISVDNGQSWQDGQGEIEVQISGATFDDAYGPHYGDIVTLTGRLSAPSPHSTPEVLASMAFPGLSINNSDGNPLLSALYHGRTVLAGIFLRALPQPLAALFSALFLSLRTPSLKPLLLSFNVTGTAHLIAPSGFKVTLLGGLLSEKTRWLPPRQESQDQKLLPAQKRRGNWRRWLHTLLIILGIALYTVLSGAGPAAIRAGIMGILLVCAPRLGRFYNVYTALALTGLLMCLVDPFVLWDTGFQLSFIGTLGIVLLTPFFQRWLGVFKHIPMGQHIGEIVAVTLAAQVATLPIFILSFNQISFIAPLANILSVPLLGVLLSLGVLICLVGCVSLPLATICGWVAWPLLKYLTVIIPWCAQLPGAYIQVDTAPTFVAWLYYALLGWITLLLFMRGYTDSSEQHRQQQQKSLLSGSRKRTLQSGLAFLIILITVFLAQAFQSDDRLKITLLISGDPAQGEALLLHTPGGLTALIDQGANSTTLAKTLDAHLPFWQRSLDLIVLTDASSSNLDGMQDIVTRYQVNQVVDAGMLHPTLAYARWRRTLSERNLHYTQVRQGATIVLDRQVQFQVLSPSSRLHKGSSEVDDNALILRLQAPGLRMLLLNTASLSNYALQTLLANTNPAYLQADFVLITGSMGKAFPAAFADVLAIAHPSFLVERTMPARKGLKLTQMTTLPHIAGPWQILQTQQIDMLEITSDAHGWNLNLQRT